MTSSTTYEVGDVVLARITFTGGVGSKKRPAVVLSTDAYHLSRADTIIVPLTTKMRNTYHGDYDLVDWDTAGLPVACRSKGIIQTIERATIERHFGKLTARDLVDLQGTIRLILGL